MAGSVVHALEKYSQWCPEGSREFAQVEECHVAFSALHATDVVPVQTAQFREPFL
jgi:hypothetical protein